MEDIIIFLGIAFNLNLPLLTAWLLDHWLGDPVCTCEPILHQSQLFLSHHKSSVKFRIKCLIINTSGICRHIEHS